MSRSRNGQGLEGSLFEGNDQSTQVVGQIGLEHVDAHLVHAGGSAVALDAAERLVFGLDLVTTIPFGRAAAALDIGFLIAAAILGYLSYVTLREQG
jgi:hypothetical protein